jgi:50S ribosomal subunit-associated GTPase HflX
MEFLYMDDSNLFHSHFIINKKINELQLHIKDLEMKRKNNDTFLTFHDNQFQKKITKYQRILNKCKLDMIKKSILIYNNNIDIRNIKKEIQKNNEVLVLNTIKNKLDELYSSNLLKNRTYINNKKKIEESFLDDYILNTINKNAKLGFTNCTDFDLVINGVFVKASITLKEVVDADLLLHTIDLSDPHYKKYIEAVKDVLKEIGALQIPQLFVFNKIDKMEPYQVEEEYLDQNYPDCVEISAQNNINIDKLNKVLFKRIYFFLNTKQPTWYGCVPRMVSNNKIIFI